MKNNEFFESLSSARGIEVDKKYYAKTYTENIYPGRMAENHIRMFCKGEGKELYPKDGMKEKAACLYSSSMLSYNFFHWISANRPLVFDGVKYTHVVFEEQFRVLKNRNNKANLDVVLVSDGEGQDRTVLLLESKFTEHFKTGPVEIKPAYDDAENGYFAYGEEWVGVIKQLRERMGTDEKTYFEGLKQVTCHLIGISNVIENLDARDKWFNKNSWLYDQYGIRLTGKERFLFKSLVFHPKTKEESDLSADYEQKNKDFVSANMGFLPNNIHIDDPIITYRDLWDRGLKESIKNPELMDYLERFLGAHK